MSCGRGQLLEPFVLGELAPTVAAELAAHLGSCARCRHEVDWLKTEYGLARMRAGRDEVASLWEGVAARSGLEGRRPWPPRVAAIVTAVALVLPLLLWATGRSRGEPSELSSSAPVLESRMTTEVAASSSPPAGPECSSLPEGLGFRCGPVTQASFVASR